MKTKRKYVRRDIALTETKVSRCGHVSKEGRYFKCENCLAVLSSEDWNENLVYFGEEGEEEEFNEQV